MVSGRRPGKTTRFVVSLGQNDASDQRDQRRSPCPTSPRLKNNSTNASAPGESACRRRISRCAAGVACAGLARSSGTCSVRISRASTWTITPSAVGGGDEHVRLRDHRRPKTLPSLKWAYPHSDDPEEAARIAAEFYAENQRVKDMLTAKGFGLEGDESGGTLVNHHLLTHSTPVSDGN